jgi:signal transduction histidine kinase/HAMP domain-containing protein
MERIKLHQTISFRFWLVLIVLSVTVAIPVVLNLYSYQKELLQANTKENFDANSKIAASLVRNALEQDDFLLLQNYLTEIQESGEFAYIAIVENDSVFVCQPPELRNEVLANPDDFNRSHAKVHTSFLSGELILASSKEVDATVIKELSRPVLYLSAVAFLTTLVLLVLASLFLSRPVLRAVQVAKALSEQDYEVPIKGTKRTDEIGQLENSLIILRDNLVSLKEENEQFTDRLEEKVRQATKRLERKNFSNLVLLDISNIFLSSDAQFTSDDKVLAAFRLINQAFGFSFAAALLKEKGAVVVQHCEGVLARDIEQLPFWEKMAEKPTDGHLYHFLIEASKDKPAGGEGKVQGWELAAYPYLDASDRVNYLLFEGGDASKQELEAFLSMYLNLYRNFQRFESSEEELRELNKTLEQKVLEKIKQNLEMANNLVAQDKLATIGEMSAAVAHDLNTPLGAIKASAENISYMTKGLLEQASSFSESEFYLLGEMMNGDLMLDIFKNSRQVRLEQPKIEDWMKTHRPGLKDSGLSSALASAGFESTHEDWLGRICDLESPEVFIMAVNELMGIKIFLQGIEDSVDKGTQVIRNLSRFVSEDLEQERNEISLRNGFEVIEGLFRHRIRAIDSYEIKVDPDIKVFGVEVKLFQLWSNLIKNGLDALNEEGFQRPEGKKMVIEAVPVENGMVDVHIRNNGPEIPENIKGRIFKKFYTTKQKRHGTGLGLSIVSNLVAEHKGEISLTSDAEETVFTVRLPLAGAKEGAEV